MIRRRRKEGIEDIFEEMYEIIQGMLESGSGTGESLVWGFSLSQIGDAPPEIHEFGNMSLKDGIFTDPAVESGYKKPLIDILEAEDTLHVVVEMPGVTRDDISLDSNGTSLDIRAASKDRNYSEQVELPVRVLPDSARATYNNGVLEVVFRYDTADKKSISLH